MRELVPTIAAAVTPLILLSILLVGPSLGLVEWQPPLLWMTEFGTPCGTPCTHIENAVEAVSADKTGVYAAGYVGEAASPPVPATSTYSFLKRYDLNGGQVWSRNLGSPVVTGIGLGADGVYIAALNGSASIVQKYDLNGNAIWTSQLGNIDVYASPISVGGAGVYVAGLGPRNPNSTYPIVVRDFDFDGNAVWSNAPANVGVAGLPRIYAGATGVYVTGSDPVDRLDTHAFVSKYDFTGALQWRRQFDEPPGFTCWCGTDGISGDGSGIYILGSTFSAFPGHSLNGLRDTFVRKYDSNGNVLWTIQFRENGLQIFANPSGVYLLGDSVLRYDGSGNRVWSLPMPRSAAAVAVGDNGVYVGGFGAFIAGYSMSSSLVIFGVNPPFSFVIAGLLVGAVVLSVLWLRKGWRMKARPTIATSPRYD